MKKISLFAPSILAFVSTSLFFRTFEFFNINIGSLWVNVIFYYVILIGILFMFLMGLSKFFQLLFGFILFVYFFSSLIEKTRIESIPVFVLLVFLISLFLKKWMEKIKAN